MYVCVSIYIYIYIYIYSQDLFNDDLNLSMKLLSLIWSNEYSLAEWIGIILKFLLLHF